MKKILVIVCAACIAGGAFAQSGTIDSKFGLDSLKTLQKASICSQYVREKNYADALDSWRYLFLYAPAYQQRTYIQGETIIKEAYARTRDLAYIDTLMMVYDQRIKYFGKDPRYDEGYLLGKKGADLFRFRRNDRESVKAAYNYLNKSFEISGPRTNNAVLLNIFNCAGDLMRLGEMDQTGYVELYMQLDSYLDKAILSAQDPAELKDTKDKIEAMFLDAGITDCDVLSKVLGQKYEEDKGNVENLKFIASLLRRSECLDGQLYADVAESLYKADPSADAAYSLAVLFGRRQDFDKMESYLEEAVAKSTDEEAKSDYYVKLANIKYGKHQYTEVKKLCLAALKGNPQSGQAYMLIGKAYAAYAPKYGGEDFDHKTVFWAVVDKFQTAKRIDPSVADEADKLISIYTQNFPSVQEGFFNGLQEGDSYTIGDWINEKTTVHLVK